MATIGKRLVAMFGSQVFSIIVSVTSTIILARLLGAEDRGVYAIFLSVPTILALLLTFGLPQVNLIYSGLDKSKREQLLTLSLATVVVSSIVAILGLFGLEESYLRDFLKLEGIDGFHYFTMSSLIFLFALNFVLKEILKGYDEIISVSKVSVIESSLLLFSFLLCFHLNLTLSYVLFFQVLISLIVSILLFFQILRRHKPTKALEYKYLKRVSHRAGLYYLASLSIAIALHSPTVILSLLNINLVDIACFSVALALIQRFEILPATLVNVLTPTLANQNILKDKALDNVMLAARINMIVALILIPPSILTLQFLVVPLLGHDFYKVTNLFLILSLGSFIASNSKIFNIYFNILDKPSYETIPTWVRCIIQVVLPYFVIVDFGIEGFAFVIVVSRTVRCLLSLHFLRLLSGSNRFEIIPKVDDFKLIFHYIKRRV